MTNSLGETVLLPVRSYLRIAAPIRLLSMGVLVNKAGGFIAVFLTPILATRDITIARIGIALLVSAGFGMAGSWLGGALIHRVGARRMIILSMSGTAFFAGTLAFAENYLLIVGLVCFFSLFNQAYVPAAATLIGRLSQPGEHVKLYSVYQLFLNVGAAIGPAAAGFLITRSLTALLLIDAATSAVFALLCLRLPRDTTPSPDETSQSSPRVQRAVLGDLRFLLFCVSLALLIVVFVQSAGPLPLHMKAHGLSFDVLGYLFTGNAIAVILFQMPLSLSTRGLPVWMLLSISSLLIGGGYMLLLAGATVPYLIVSFALWTAGEIILCPVALTVAAVMSTPRTQGIYQGAVALARSAGMRIGPAIGVFAFSIGESVPWWGSGVLTVITVGLFFGFLRGLPRLDGSDAPATACR